MSEVCNRRICAIVILTVGGYLITLPGSANAISTIQSTRGIPSTTSATHRRVSTTLPATATPENDEATTQGYVSSTTKSAASTVPSANTIHSSSTLETATKIHTTENGSSTEGYSTFTTTESPNSTTFSEASTEHLSTSSTLDMSTASTEFPKTLQGSTSSPMEGQTSSTEIPSASTYLSTDNDKSVSTETVTSLTTSTQTKIASNEVETFSNTPDSFTVSNANLGTTAGPTSMMGTSYTTNVVDTSASSTSMEGLSTTMEKVGTQVGSTSTTATTPGTTIPDQTPMSSISFNTPEGLSTTMEKAGTPVGSTSTTATTPGTSIPAQTPMSTISFNTPEGLSTTMEKAGTPVGSTSTTATTLGTSIPAQTPMSSISFNTPEGLSTTVKEVRTPVVSTPKVTTTSQSITHRSTSTSPKPTTSPSYPAPTLADIKSEDAVKKVKIEIKVLKESNEGCEPDNKTSCENFIDTVETEIENYYRNIQGFFKVEVTNLRPGSILVEHDVSYTYSEMKPEDKGLTAQEVYDNTIGPDVGGGKLGDLKVSTCNNCKEPEDLTNLCDFEESVDCGVYLADCTGGYVFCVSPCDNNPSFCSSRGDCNQDEGVAAKCSCHSVDNGYYYGDNCEHYFNQTVTIICVAVAGGFIFGIAVACAVTRCRRKKTLGRYRQYYMDDMGEEGYLWNESYALEGALEGEEDLIDLTSDEDPKLEFTFNSSLTAHTD